MAADLEVAPLGSGLQSLETHRPTTILGHGGNTLAGELHGHRFTVGGVPPDRHRPALLQNRVIGEEGMEGHVGPNKAQAQGQTGERDEGATEEIYGMHAGS
jgi:hypothetical protein